MRTQKWGMVENYRFIMRDSYIKNLDINHSFHFFVTGKGAFADEITLVNNAFTNVTGDILRLDSEIEDLGIYNAEYVTLQDNLFEDVQGALLKLYRGGTDESTLDRICWRKETSSSMWVKASVIKPRQSCMAFRLLTWIVISGLPAPIKVEHTVGEPQTAITQMLIETPAPAIKELRVEGPHTATVADNQFENGQ